MFRTKALVCALVLSCWSFLCSSACAQDDDYKGLTAAAVEEHSLGHYEEARALFAKAHAINPNARTLWGMGTAAFEARQYVDAIQLLDAALTDTRKPLTAAQRKQAESLRERSEDFIVRLHVTLRPNNASLSVDGHVVQPNSSGVVILDSGMHQIVAAADGYDDWVRGLRWSAGEASLAINLKRNGATTSQNDKPADDGTAQAEQTKDFAAKSTGALGVLKWVALGSTVAAAAVAGVGFGKRQAAAHAYNDDVKCPEPKESTCSNIHASGQKWKTMGIVGSAAAGAFAVSTVVLFILDRKKHTNSEAPALACAPYGASVGLVCAARY